LLLKSTRVLILHSGSQRACLFPSPYLDAHGEEDEHMRRGRPLFLSDARCSFLEKLWACGALEHDSRATGSSRLGGEWY
jgi:E3 ubiquitin-protein ligase UBR3